MKKIHQDKWVGRRAGVFPVSLTVTFNNNRVFTLHQTVF